jgi:hypothetical protein
LICSENLLEPVFHVSFELIQLLALLVGQIQAIAEAGRQYPRLETSIPAGTSAVVAVASIVGGWGRWLVPSISAVPHPARPAFRRLTWRLRPGQA